MRFPTGQISRWLRSRLETAIPGLLEDTRQVGHGLSFAQRFLADGPESEDKGLASMADPLLGKIEREISRAINLQRGITDD